MPGFADFLGSPRFDDLAGDLPHMKQSPTP